eukprot:gb/GECG01012977.1/.p1 GENE.gb/GECG01012977.1/~~gb/GECG01012977.1/.p1  ORF type:complete len:1054 (+),score=126.95 gb/GECG01012977.1/:1-3162(+)
MQHLRQSESKTPEPGGSPPSPGFSDATTSMGVKMEPKYSRSTMRRMRSFTQGDAIANSKLPPKSSGTPSPSHSPQHLASPAVTKSSPIPGTPSSEKGNNSSDDSENVRVVVRPRPLHVHEIEKGQSNSISVTEDRKHLKLFFPEEVVGKNEDPPEKHYGFSYCATRDTDQEQFFEECGVKELIRSVSRGFSASVIAYGQTGSGKTYTTVGEDGSLRYSDFKDGSGSHGLVPRSLQFLFQLCEQEPESSWHVSATYCEIYNEQVFDLLSQSSAPLPIKWETLDSGRRKSTGNLKSIKGHYFVENLSNVPCKHAQDVLDVLTEGSRVRRVRNHQLNMQSSRSHSIFTVYVTWTSEIEKQDRKVVKTSKTSKIVFVDLAGSERLKSTQSTGEGLKETTNINRSLFALGNVISALSEKPKRVHRQNSTSSLPATTKEKDVGQIVVPYRDSVLTKLLMDSLGGNCYTIMIACVTPSDAYVDETMNTLNYASRACRIRNHPTITESNSWTEIVTTLQRQIRELYLENEKLRQQVRESQSDRSVHSDKDSQRGQDTPADSPIPPGYRQLVKFADKESESADNHDNEAPARQYVELDGENTNHPVRGSRKPSLSIETNNVQSPAVQSPSPDFVQDLPQSCKRADEYQDKQRSKRTNSISSTPIPLPQGRRGSTVSHKELLYGPKSQAKKRRSLPGGASVAEGIWSPRGTPTGSKTPRRQTLPPVSARRSEFRSPTNGPSQTLPQRDSFKDISNNSIQRKENEPYGDNNGGDSDPSVRTDEGVGKRKQAEHIPSSKDGAEVGVRFKDVDPSHESATSDAKKDKRRRNSTTGVTGSLYSDNRHSTSATRKTSLRAAGASANGIAGGSRTTEARRRRHSVSTVGSSRTANTTEDSYINRLPKPSLSQGDKDDTPKHSRRRREVTDHDGDTARRRSRQHSRSSKGIARRRIASRGSVPADAYAHPTVTSSEGYSSAQDSAESVASADPYAHPNSLSHPLASDKHDKPDSPFKTSSFASLMQLRDGEEGNQLRERIEELKHREMQLLVKLSSQEEQLRSRTVSGGE